MFYGTLFSFQPLFLVLVVVVGSSMGFTDVATARFSQTVNVCILVPCFYVGWKLLPKVPPGQTLPINPKTGKPRSLWTHGFIELWNTAKRINNDYKLGLRWFLLGTIFAESSMEAFALVAVIFLDEEMGLSSVEIGLFFVVGMVAMPFGAYLSRLVASKTNPKISLMAAIVAAQANAVTGALLLNKDNIYPGGYIWGAFVGLISGWYYPSQVRISP